MTVCSYLEMETTSLRCEDRLMEHPTFLEGKGNLSFEGT
jgi:hypothetical protein